MNEKRHSFGVTYDSVQGQVYVLGGHDGLNTLGMCERYCERTAEWVDISSMNTNRFNLSACIFDCKFIFAIGGQYYEFLNSIEKYSI